MGEPQKTWTILAVLDWTRGHFAAKGIDNPRLDAELIIAHALKLQRIMLYARFDQPLSVEELAQIRGLVARRARGEPLAYLFGEKEFWSLPFEVSPAVLIPRPDSETLVQAALGLLAGRPAPRFADVGTGSGCLAIALLSERTDAVGFALDRSSEALALAAKNAARSAVHERLTLLSSDLLAGLPESARPLDLILANLPYIPSGEIGALQREVRDFEPRAALDGGPDGLRLIHRLIQGSAGWLGPGGALALEIGHDQAAAVRQLLAEAGFGDISLQQDLAGLERVVTARVAC